MVNSTRILLGSMFLEKLFESLRIEQRFHDATDHDAEGHRRTMRENLHRNQLEASLSEQCLESVETLGAASLGVSIGVGAGIARVHKILLNAAHVARTQP